MSGTSTLDGELCDTSAPTQNAKTTANLLKYSGYRNRESGEWGGIGFFNVHAKLHDCCGGLNALADFRTRIRSGGTPSIFSFTRALGEADPNNIGIISTEKLVEIFKTFSFELNQNVINFEFDPEDVGRVDVEKVLRWMRGKMKPCRRKTVIKVR